MEGSSQRQASPPAVRMTKPGTVQAFVGGLPCELASPAVPALGEVPPTPAGSSTSPPPSDTSNLNDGTLSDVSDQEGVSHLAPPPAVAPSLVDGGRKRPFDAISPTPTDGAAASTALGPQSSLMPPIPTIVNAPAARSGTHDYPNLCSCSRSKRQRVIPAAAKAIPPQQKQSPVIHAYMMAKLKECEEKATKLVDIIAKYIDRSLPGDRFEVDGGGRSLLFKQVLSFVRNQSKLMILMVASPHKSASALSYHPDSGDYTLIRTIASLCRDLNREYSKGVVFKIVSDGYIVNDIRGVSDHAVKTYIDGLRSMVNMLGASEDIHIVTLADFANSEHEKRNIGKIRREFFKRLPDKAKIARAVSAAADPTSRSSVSSMALAFRGFQLEECLHLQEMNELAMPCWTHLSRAQITAKANEVALARLRRHIAFNQLCRDNIQREHLRFSLFPQLNDGPKYALKATGLPTGMSPTEFRDLTGLTYDPYRPSTPWSNVPLVFQGDRVMVLPRSKVLSIPNVVLEHKNGRPYCYRLLTPEAAAFLKDHGPRPDSPALPLDEIEDVAHESTETTGL